MTRRAVDFANYTPVPTAEQVRCWMTQGYTTAIIGTSFGSVADDQIEACEKAGMDVEEYQFVGRMHTTVHRVWLDVELDETVEKIRQAIVENHPYGIYTRRGVWDGLGNWDIVSEFPWLKLWDASYGDPPPAFVPYGGFTERAIHQWHDSTDLCGLNVDLNIIEEEVDMPLTDDDLNKIAHKLATDPEFIRALSDTSHAGANRTVDLMVERGQVKPPKP